MGDCLSGGLEGDILYGEAISFEIIRWTWMVTATTKSDLWTHMTRRERERNTKKHKAYPVPVNTCRVIISIIIIIMITTTGLPHRIVQHHHWTW